MGIPAILQQLGRNQAAPAMGQIKQMMQMVRSAGNPQAALGMLAERYPQLKEAMEIVNRHGGDPWAAFRAEAEARGVDPNEILNMMK